MFNEESRKRLRVAVRGRDHGDGAAHAEDRKPQTKRKTRATIDGQPMCDEMPLATRDPGDPR